MACDISLGRLEPCKNQVGGIDAVYFVNFGDLGVVTTGADDEITDMDGTFSAYKYEIKDTSSNLTQTPTSSRDAGTTFFSQAVNLTLKEITKEMNKELKLLSWGRPHIVVADRNGNALMVGLERGTELTGGSIVTGGAMGDLSGYTLAMSAEEKLPASIIEGATVADPFAGMTSATVTIVEGV